MSKESAKEDKKVEEIRRRLAGKTGPDYWRSLEECSGSEEFQELLAREFPAGAALWSSETGRRQFLRLMGASLALAGIGACTRQPDEEILPYVKAPEELVAGRPLFFASALTLGGFARGVLVESHMGRPTKLEGNPEHPSSLGATDTFTQASILELYDPDRSQVLTERGRISTWGQFLASLKGELEVQRLKNGAGLRLLTETVTSPTLAAQIRQLLERFPKARWHQFEPLHPDNALAGSQLAFGRPVDTYCRLDRARVIVSLGADLLASGPGCLRHAREFISGRPARAANPESVNRLWAIESTPTLTGAMADERRLVRPSSMPQLAWDLYSLVQQAEAPPGDAWLAALAAELRSHPGEGVVVAGDDQPPEVHHLVHLLNHALGNNGKTVLYSEPVEAEPVGHHDSLRELVEEMEAGRVDLLVMVGGNPVYSAPADLDFAGGLREVRTRVHLSLYQDETSALCDWHIPACHTLESWGDARSQEGTVTLIQPLIAPLYGGTSPHVLLDALNGKAGRSDYQIVREYWKGRRPAGDFDSFWERALNRGLIPGTEAPLLQVFPRPALAPPPAPASSGLELLFRADPTVYDGRFANNGWLQELPKPFSKLTWENAAWISPATARSLGLEQQEIVELEWEGRSLKAPLWIMPGQAEGCLTVHLGYGRTRAGRVGDKAGFNAYLLRPAEHPWGGPGLQLRGTGEKAQLAATQHHHLMEGRALVRSGTYREFQRHPAFVAELGEAPAPEMTLYPPAPEAAHAWGMAINLGACIGCSACTLACQAENNIPVVGKEQVRIGREMHWIRVDHYYQGPPESPRTVHQPVPCMQCENAPCEPVCPVAATVHSSEGLNDMVYNRCVGTRYCSNNCPYKVRRFNFLLYQDFETPSLKLLRNPDVSVRSRGVMEKCTYCVQRINAARIDAKKEDRPLRDGDIRTACQQVCPTEAIVFGDLKDPESRVSKMKASPLHYTLLAEVNTRPRTGYLARLLNPSPELEAPNG